MQSPNSFFPTITLAGRTAARPAQVATVDVGGFSGVIELFEKAKHHLKAPRIVLALPPGTGEENMIVLNVATQMSSVPGSINIKEWSRNPETGQRKWIGRVFPDGKFQPSNAPNVADRIKPMTELLSHFSKDPASVAAAHGILTGLCCFCNRPLTDERSTSVGYGPLQEAA